MTGPGGKLHESCDDCDWQAYWDGGTAAEDPGLAHAGESGHTVTGRVADTAATENTENGQQEARDDD